MSGRDQPALGLREPPVDLGEPLLHEAFDFLDLCVRLAAGVLGLALGSLLGGVEVGLRLAAQDFGFNLGRAAHFVQRARDLMDLGVSGTAQFVLVLQGGVAKLGELGVGLLPHVGG